METNLEKAKRQLKDNAATSGFDLPDDGFLMKMLELAAIPDTTLKYNKTDYKNELRNLQLYCIENRNFLKASESSADRTAADAYQDIRAKIHEIFECECDGEYTFKSEKDFSECEISGSLFSDSEMIDWLHLIMSPDSDYCEVFFSGLRNFKTGYATAFQVESNPEKFKTVNATTLRESITLAMIEYNNPQ